MIQEIKNLFPFKSKRSLLVLVGTLFCFNLLMAEGAKELMPTSTDVTMLYTNGSTYGKFAGYGCATTSRLNIHITNPSTERVYLGFSQAASIANGTDGNLSTTPYYFRIKDATGNIVFGPQKVDNTNANANTWALASAGPAPVVGASGYTPFTYTPASGATAGDYYIEFSDSPTAVSATDGIAIKYFDITVATQIAPTAIKGRVWSQNWALRTPSISQGSNATYTYYDRPFNGQIYGYTNDGFVSKVDFKNSGYQGLTFALSFNEYGVQNTGNITADRQSVAGNSTLPEFKLFLNDPDNTAYPSGNIGAISTTPFVMNCPGNASLCLAYSTTQSGLVQILLDFNSTSGAGIYDPGTEDVLIYAKVIPATGETAPYKRCTNWDGKNGLGKTVSSTIPIPIYLTYTQGTVNFPAYDVEYLVNGYNITPVRPTPSAGFTPKLYYDDSKIAAVPGNGSAQTNPVNGCTLPCHRWTNYNYGNLNTINTWWNGNQSTSSSALLPVTPSCAFTGSTAVCSASTGNTYTGPVGQDTYAWTITGSGTISGAANAQTVSVTAGASGTYTLTLTTTTSTCTQTCNSTVSVGLTTSISGAASVCYNTPGFVYTAPSGMSSYAWTVSGNGTINGSATGQTVTVDAGAAGTFTVNLTVTGGAGGTCSATASFPVTVTSTCSVIKDLYLQSGSILNRVDPVNTGASTTSTSAILGMASGSGAVGVDATTNGAITTGSSITVAHTTTSSGTNRLMLVGISIDDSDGSTVTGVTSGGTALTKVSYQKGASFVSTYIYSLLAPTSGTSNVIVTFSKSLTYGAEVGVTTYTGVNQTTPYGTVVSATSSGTSASVSVSSATNNLVYAVVAAELTAGTGGAVIITPGAGQTTLYSGASTYANGAGSTKAGAASTVMSSTFSTNSVYAISGLSINPATVVVNYTSSYTQSASMCSQLTLPANGTVTVKNYITVLSGSMPASPNIVATLSYGSTSFLTLTNPTYTSATGLLTWTATLPSNVTIPAGQSVALKDSVSTALTGVTFQIDYGSSTYPSKVSLPTTSYINVNSLGFYNAAYPSGTLQTIAQSGVPLYARSVVSDPFGTSDITGLGILLTPPSGSPVSGAATSVATSGCTTTYEYAFTPTLTGTYTVRDTAKEGYEKTVTALKSNTISACSLTVTTTAQNPSCTNANGGEIDLTVTGDSGPFTYNWAKGATTGTGTGTIITGLAAGTYNITVTSPQGCTGTGTVTLVTPTTPTATSTATNVVCNGGATGTMSVTPAGGLAPFRYLWADGNTLQNRTTLNAATWVVTVTDANGCTATTSATITEPALLQTIATFTNIACFGNTTASISISNTGGTSPYTYLWENNSTSSNRTGLAAGNYSVSITDNKGCVVKPDTFQVGQPISLAASTTVVPITCTSGAVNLVATGGTSPYTFLWSNGAISQNLVVNTAGTYTVTITDVNSCTLTASATVATPTPLTATTTAVATGCFGMSTGSATVTATNVVGVLAYKWNDALGQTTSTASNLAAGIYKVTVIDAGTNCTTVASAIVSAPPAATCAPINITNVCPTTTADLRSHSSIPPTGSVVTWHTGTPATVANKVADPSMVLAGTYYSAFYDATTMCYSPTSSQVVVTINSVTATASATNPTCVALSSGSATAVPTGSSPYTYKWSDASAQATVTASGLGAGLYTVTVTDNNNCTTTATATVTAPICPPTATADAATAPNNGKATNIPILTNDKASDGTPATLTNIAPPTITVAPTHGTVTVQLDGSVDYTPTPGFGGTDMFTYQICNKNTAVCSTAVVTVTVPTTIVANFDQAKTTAGITSNISVLNNDSTNSVSATLSNVNLPTITTAPGKGTATVKPDGSIDYTPLISAIGTDSLIYQICNKLNSAVCDTAIVYFTIAPALPDPNDDVATVVNNGTPVKIPVLANDLAADKSPATLSNVLTPTVTSPPANGTVTPNADGTISYTPNPGFEGSDVFTYQICDKINTTVCRTASVAITVTPTIVANPDYATAVVGSTKNIVLITNDSLNRVPVVLTNVNPSITTPPSKGTATLKADGTVDYVPNTGATGTDTFIYQLCDKLSPAVCDTALVTIVLTNAPSPSPQPDVATTPNNGKPKNIVVLTNDKAADGTPATLSNVTPLTITIAPTHGTATVKADGSIDYTPAPGFEGTDVLTYQICDKVNTTSCATTTVTITVTPTIVASPDYATAMVGSATNIVVLTNDSLNHASVTLAQLNALPSVTTLPAKGTVTVNTDGTIDYTPNVGASGNDTFIYSICDKASPAVCDTALVTVAITSTPIPAPVADNATAPNNGKPTNIPILANDKAGDGTPATLSNVTTPTITVPPAHGTALIKPNGTLDYTPTPGFAGTDVLTYQICDAVNTSVCATTTVTIVVPTTVVANPDYASASVGTPTNIPVLTNDSTNNLKAVLTNVTLPSITTQPTQGTVTVRANGTIDYMPNVGATGTDNFIYSICNKANTAVCDTALVTINISSTPSPTPVADNATALNNGTPTNIPILNNDKASDGTPADLTNVTLPIITSAPSNGTATINPDGTLNYTPNPGFAGTDVVSYQICDKVNFTVCAITTVTIIVPTTVVANLDYASAKVGSTTNIPVLTNDSTNNVKATLSNVTLPTIANANLPTKGTATINANGTIDYIPNLGTSGVDKFIYSICNKANPAICDTALVTINITATPPPTPVADNATAPNNGTPTNIPILNNDKASDGTPASLSNLTPPTITTLPTHGTATVKPDGTLDYTPTPGFAGTDVLTYQICDKVDNGVCATTTVSIVVPTTVVANYDYAGATVGSTTNIPVLSNDSTNNVKADLTNVSLPALTTLPAKGTATVTPDGTIDYLPNVGATGTDNFIYTICNKANITVCDTALVTIVIAPTPPPTPVSDSATALNNGTATNIPILANDKASDGTPASLTNVTLPVITSAPTHGIASIKPDGTLDYTQTPGFAGTDVLIYQICDKVNYAVCVTTTVTIIVPTTVVANPDYTGAMVGSTTNIPVLGNDSTNNVKATLSNVTLPSVTTSPTKGTVTVKPDGTIDYVPNIGATGTDQLIYTLCNKANSSICDTALVTITIAQTPQPTPVADNATAPNNGTATNIPILANDKAGDGTPANLTNITPPAITTPPAHGTATVKPDGTLDYTPAPGFAGTDILTYQICDKVNTVVCATTIVTIVVPTTVVANPDYAGAKVGSTTNIPVLGNDSTNNVKADLTNVTLPIITTQPTKGTVVVKADGTIDYVPNVGATGTDNFIYTICNKANSTVCDTALVTIVIAPTPPPTPVADNATAPDNGTPTNIPILANDKASDGTPASLTNVTPPTITTPPAHGTATVKPDGTLDYTPTPGFAGTDVLTYQICDKVNTVVCATTTVTIVVPTTVVANPDYAGAMVGSTTNIPVLGNDSTNNVKATLSNVTLPSVTTSPTKGTVTVKPDGTIDYVPNIGATGTDNFIYTLCNKANSTVCDTALVTIIIAPTPAPTPVADNATAPNNGTPTNIPILANDKASDGTPATLTNVTMPLITVAPTHGSATTKPDGTLDYTPTPGFAGTDVLTYQICDKVNTVVCATTTVTIVVPTSVVANPDYASATVGSTTNIPVLTNDSTNFVKADLTNTVLPNVTTPPAKGTATVKPDGTIDYVPNVGATGTDQLIYTLCNKANSAICDTALVTITITPTPQPTPVADNATAPNNGTPTNIPILANDKASDGTPATLTNVTPPTITTTPTNGTATVKPDGTLDYSPTPGFAGTDVLTYQICDKVNYLVCSTTTVTIVVPTTVVGNPDYASAAVGSTTNIPVLYNDSTNHVKAALSNVTVPTLNTQPLKGTVTVKTDGTIDYTPNIGASGTDNFIYTICNKANSTVCDTALVTVVISPTPPPTPFADNAIAPSNGTPTNVPILANDKASDGTPATLTNVTLPVITSQPSNGTAMVKPDGTLDYTPNPGFAGTDILSYQICDKVNNVVCAMTMVTMTVPTTIIANPDYAGAIVGSTTNIPVLSNDSTNNVKADLTNVSLPTIAAIDKPTKGTATVKPDGTIDYVPNIGATGTDQFIYSVCNKANSTVCDTALVTIVIAPTPPPTPVADNATAPNNGTPTNIPILANDKASDGTPASLTNVTPPTITTPPAHGTATVKPDGTLDYTPTPGFAGTDVLTYQICDKVNTVVCATTTVTIVVPTTVVANPDYASAKVGSTTNIPVLGNDSTNNVKADLTNVTLPSVIAQSAKGTVVVKTDGTIDYVPNIGAIGTDNFIYTICNKANNTVCDTALVTVILSPTPPPTPVADNATAPDNGTPTNIPILANDKASDGTPATLTNVTLPVITSQPSNGTAMVKPDGTLDYTPNPGFAGTDILSYQICDKVNNVVCAMTMVTMTVPTTIIANPDYAGAIVGSTTNIPVLSNDSTNNVKADLTNVSLPTIAAIDKPTKGTATVKPDGTIDYVPNIGATGTDQFIYSVCNKANSTVCDTALVTIVIAPTPPPTPVADNATAPNNGTPTNIPILANDKASDGTPASLTNVTPPTITTPPAHGTATVKPDGTLDYTPTPGFAGTDVLTYQICDKVNTVVCSTTTVTILVPTTVVANPDYASAKVGSMTNIPILGNDSTNNVKAGLTNVTLPIITTQPTKGTVVVKADGTVDYVPNIGTSGTDSFIYSICNKANTAICDTALVTVNISTTPPPTPVADNATAPNNGKPTNIPILANDKASDGSPASLSNVTLPVITSTPSHGVANIKPDGTLDYTPTPGFAGTDVLMYQICDKVNFAVCATTTITIVVPTTVIANPDYANATVGSTTNIPVFSNDSTNNVKADLTNVILPILNTQPLKGTVTVKADGTIDYTPNIGESGTDNFIYTICNKANSTVCDTALVTITIAPTPPPTPFTDNATAPNNGTPTNIPILVNDKASDGTLVTLTNVTLPVITAGPTHGSASIKPDGTLDYTPTPGFAGTDVLTYQICDKVNYVVCSTTTVNIIVPATVIANPDYASASVGSTTNIQVLTNDSTNHVKAFLSNVTLPNITTQPAKGTATVNADGTLDYVPNVGATGTDNFIYIICNKIKQTVCDTALVTVNITPTAPPTPVADNATAPNNGVPTNIPVLNNDKASDGTPATLSNVTPPTITSPPSNGTATVKPDGTIDYKPTPGFAGTDVLTYQICDLINYAVCATTTVTVTVPTSVIANPDYASAAVGSTTNIPVLNNDSTNHVKADLTNVTLPSVSTSASKGTATVKPDGTIDYVPNIGATGTDNFIYTICNKANNTVCDTALVTVIISPTPPPTPVADNATAPNNGTPTNIPILANDKASDGTPATLSNVTLPVITSTPSHGVASIKPDGTLDYTPTPGFSGIDILTYQICDKVNNVVCATTTVTITVPPTVVANPDYANAKVGSTTNIPVLSNDSTNFVNADLTNVTLPAITKVPAKGTATVKPDGTIDYVPNVGATGTDQLIYTLCNKPQFAGAVYTSVCDTALVTITITPTPPPTPVTDNATAPNNGTPTNIPVLNNDKASDGTPATLANVTPPTITSPPSNGTATVKPDGTIDYIPTPGFSGPDVLTYQICDLVNYTVCATTTVTILVPPTVVANPDYASASVGSTTNIPVSSNDSTNHVKADLSNVTLPSVTTPATKGTATVKPDGTIDYVPNVGATGTDNFIYTICNKTNSTVCDTALVTVVISPTPPPTPVADNATAPNNGTPTNIPILANDKASDGIPATLANVTPPTITSLPSNGTATVKLDGTIDYTPTPGFGGTDVLTYQICDKANIGVCATTTVTINVPTTVVANPDVVAAMAGHTLNIPVLVNDSTNNTPATLANVTLPSVTTQPLQGTATVKPDGTIDYTPNAGASGTDVLIYTICNKTNSTVCDTALVTINISATLGVQLFPRAFLYGSYDPKTDLMYDSLRAKNLIPLQQPYSGVEYTDFAYNGTESTTSAVLNVTGTNAIVDWVIVELRSATNPKTVVIRKAALVQRTGDIVDVDGVSAVTFSSTIPASYFVTVKHRNHIGVMTATAIPLTIKPTLVDFTVATTDNYKTTSLDKDYAQKPLNNGKRAMWLGNIHKDNAVIFQGPNNDVNDLYLTVLTNTNNNSFLANYILTGYLRGDVDMDGKSIYQGPGNEVDKIFFEVVLHPINTSYLYNFIINEQIPK